MVVKRNSPICFDVLPIFLAHLTGAFYVGWLDGLLGVAGMTIDS